ncbi:MAG: alpha/beta fold hydrolase, partial [Betaproteobacteria bacterium]|nr:alpha/beta fold hydrolase [Betaproteobacteria bacterium]
MAGARREPQGRARRPAARRDSGQSLQQPVAAGRAVARGAARGLDGAAMKIESRTRGVQCISPAGLHRISYLEWGETRNPRVLVCAHGLTRCARDFDNLASALAGHYRVICPDFAGRGESDWLADPMLYQIPQYVSDMVTLIARLDVAEVHWVGTSMG